MSSFQFCYVDFVIPILVPTLTVNRNNVQLMFLSLRCSKDELVADYAGRRVPAGNRHAPKFLVAWPEFRRNLGVV